MESQSPPVFPKKQVIALAIAFLICLLLVIFNGCKKGIDTSPKSFTPEQLENFFKLPFNAPPEAEVVATAMQQQLNEEKVQDFLSWHGQPVWSRVTKLYPTSGGPATYLIPITKADTITAFLGATVVSANKVLFELHRKSSQLSGAKEFTYAGITSAKSRFFLNYFDGKPAVSNAAVGKNPTGSSNLDYCWWEAVVVPCHAFANTDSIPSLAVPRHNTPPPVCFNWIEHCDPIDDGDEPGGGGGGGGEPGGGGGNGGGNGGEQCPLWYSLLPPVDPCWPTEPPKDTVTTSQVLTLLHDENVRIKLYRDSTWDSAIKHNWEYRFLIGQKNGTTTAIGRKTDSLPFEVSNKYSTSFTGYVIMGDYHTHNDFFPKDRHPHDPNDITESNFTHDNRRLLYRSYVDCGDTLYVIVNENLSKMESFNRTHNFMYIHYHEWQVLGSSQNRRADGLQLLFKLLGLSSYSGVGVYKSINADKTIFQKIN
jgi:hypothetical protein